MNGAALPLQHSIRQVAWDLNHQIVAPVMWIGWGMQAHTPKRGHTALGKTGAACRCATSGGASGGQCS